MVVGRGTALLRGAAVHVASADHDHVFCNADGAAGHGFVHGGSTTDGAWHARWKPAAATRSSIVRRAASARAAKGFPDRSNRPATSSCTGYLYKDQLGVGVPVSGRSHPSALPRRSQSLFRGIT